MGLRIIFTFFLFFNFIIGFGQNYFQEGCKQYYEFDDYNKAIELFTKAIENNQELANSYLLRGASKIVSGQYAGATADLEASIAIDSNNYKAYYYYGRFYFTQGFFQTSIKYYDKAIMKNPKAAANAYDDRAIAKAEKGDYNSALIDEATAISLEPKRSNYWCNRGIIKLKLKLYKESISDFDEAIKLDNDPQAYSNRGVAYSELKLYSKAIDDFTISIEKLPYAKDLPYLRGLSYIAIGKKDLACIDFEKSQKMGHSIAQQALNKYCLAK